MLGNAFSIPSGSFYVHYQFIWISKAKEYIMSNAGLDEAQAGIKIARKYISNLRYADDTTLWQKMKKN